MLLARNARKQDAKIVSVTSAAKYYYLDMFQGLERAFSTWNSQKNPVLVLSEALNVACSVAALAYGLAPTPAACKSVQLCFLAVFLFFPCCLGVPVGLVLQLLLMRCSYYIYKVFQVLSQVCFSAIPR